MLDQLVYVTRAHSQLESDRAFGQPSKSSSRQKAEHFPEYDLIYRPIQDNSSQHGHHTTSTTFFKQRRVAFIGHYAPCSRSCYPRPAPEKTKSTGWKRAG